MNTRLVAQTELSNGLFTLVSDQVHIIGTADTKKKELKDGYDKIAQEILRIEKIIARNNFLPFENGQEEYQRLLPPLRQKAEYLRMALCGYEKWIDPSFLTWCQKETKLPVFMVLDPMDNKGFKIEVNTVDQWETFSSLRVTFHPNTLPTVIRNQYTGTVERLSEMVRNEFQDIAISATYSGIMPPETRKKMRQAVLSQLFVQIFIVAEAPKWQVNRTTPARTDPLVIGITSSQTIYLIDEYDPTDLEHCVIEEYIFPSIPR